MNVTRSLLPWVHSNVTGHLVLPTMPFLKLICQVFCHRKEKSSYHNYTVVRRHIQRFTMEPFLVGFRANPGAQAAAMNGTVFSLATRRGKRCACSS